MTDETKETTEIREDTEAELTGRLVAKGKGSDGPRTWAEDPRLIPHESTSAGATGLPARMYAASLDDHDAGQSRDASPHPLRPSAPPLRASAVPETRILAEAEAYVREALAGESTGHDWWHIARVRALARRLAREEAADGFICELAALLHDIADDKIAGDEATGLATVHAWLAAHGVDDATTARVMAIIEAMSFGGGNRPPMATLEGRVVQDADRLDAIGALGIARAFAYGGAHGRVLYDPDQPPRHYANKAEYRASNSSTINHFHEKLLLLKDSMHTATGQRLAAARHAYMLAFLTEFAAEWDGER